jgi:acid stress-induced BolA-like protein IbaG/YrbA
MSTDIPTPEELETAIGAALACERLQVRGDGHHFEALVVSAAFEGRGRLERHRLVYAALGDRMRERVHALSMRTLTPAEFKSAG